MPLQEIVLTNVRKFGHQRIRFQPGFNLLIGENGVGKTTILRSIWAAVGPAQSSGPSWKLNDEDIGSRKADMQIEAEGTARGRARRWSYRKRTGRPSERLGGPGILTLLYSSNEAVCKSFVRRRLRRNFGPLGEIAIQEEALYEFERETAVTATNLQRFGRSRAVRSFVIKALSKLSSQFQDFQWTFEPYRCSIDVEAQGHGDPLVSKFKRILSAAILRYLREHKLPQLGAIDRRSIKVGADGAIIGEPKLKPATAAFDALLAMEGDDTRSFLQFIGNTTAEIFLTPRIQVRTPERSFLLSQLSDGEQRLFSIFVDIARQLMVSQPGHQIGSAEAIVLIDEIDVHLHPKWQRTIVSALQELFPNCQFIATTHSPFVIQALSRGTLINLSLENPEEAEDYDVEPPEEYSDKSIEDIAEEVMKVPMPQKSEKYLQMLETAERYFRLVNDARSAKQNEIAQTRAELDRLTEPFSDDPAYMALLRVERATRLGF
jgi:predicted ATPase